MKCKYCGKEIDNDSVFCEQCGARVVDEFLVVKKGKRNSNTKKYIGLAVGAILICVIVAAIYTNILDGSSGSEGMSEPIVDTLVAPVEKYDSEREQLKAQGWVDLGLPSGTLWKNVNEEGYYSYDEAVRLFEGYIPTKSQWEELIEYCQWTWSGWKQEVNTGYNIQGRNGESIFLPNLGQKVPYKKHDVYGSGQTGCYWSSSESKYGPYVFYSYRTYCDNPDPKTENDKFYVFCGKSYDDECVYDQKVNNNCVRLAY